MYGLQLVKVFKVGFSNIWLFPASPSCTLYLVELIIFLLTQGCDKHSFNKSYRLVKSLLVSSTATWSNRIFTVWFAFYCLVMFKKKPPFSQLPRQKAQWPTEEDQYYIHVRAGAWRGSPWQGQWSCHSSELASCRHHLQGPSSLYRLQLPSDLPPVPPAAESCGELWRLYKHRHTKQMTIRRLLCHDTTQDNPLISFRKEKNKLYCLA